MSDKIQAFMQKWGPWVGPTSIVAVLAVLSRIDACAYSPVSIRALADSNTTRIESLEAITKAQQQTIKEHLTLSEARMQIQDDERMKLALTQQAVTQMKEKMESIEDKVDLLVEAAMRKGEIRR